MATKRIPISNVRLGMYISGFDRAWLDTPFFRHKFLLKTSTQLQKLKNSGVQEIEIDTSKGLDILQVEEESSASSSPPSSPDNSELLSEEESRVANLPEKLRGVALANELNEVSETREQMLEETQEILESIKTSEMVNGAQVKEFSQKILTNTLGHEEVYASLIRTREFRPELYEHILSVGTLAVLMGRLLQYDDSSLLNLAMGALLHDIGFLSLPPELNRPHHKLSSIDLVKYNLHPLKGAELLQKTKGIPNEVITMVAEHHNPHIPDFSSPDGQILPNTLSTSLHLIEIVDRYDELLSGQSTAQPLSVKDALGQLYQLGQNGTLNRPLVTSLISQIGIYPLYSLVELNTGERGIVTTLNPGHLLQPIVLVFQDQNRKPYPEPTPLNFASNTLENESLEIRKVLDAEEEGVKVDDVLANWVTY